MIHSWVGDSEMENKTKQNTKNMGIPKLLWPLEAPRRILFKTCPSTSTASQYLCGEGQWVGLRSYFPWQLPQVIDSGCQESLGITGITYGKVGGNSPVL